MRLPIDYSVRLAIIRKVGRTYIDCEFYDRFGEKLVRCPIPYPYAGRGGGFLAGIEPDTIVLLANSSEEKWYVVGFIPDVIFYGTSVEGEGDINFDESPYPELEPGELVVKGKAGQKIELLNDGRLGIDAGIGSSASDIELVPASQGMFVRVNNIYQFTEAGRRVEGIIRRDLNLKEKPEDTTSTDFLASSSYDTILSEIGRSPLDEVQYRTTTLAKSVIRNPALIEKKDITYEFADSFDVRYFESELKAMASTDPRNITNNILDLQADPSSRENRRTDTLNLHNRNYNHLIEKVQGTLVDIYGNVLDINRNIIHVPEVEIIDTSGSGNQDGLKKLYKHLRRSVKYHFEINSRKQEDINGFTAASANNNSIAHSKWSVDVDGEGLTKINIPASSETGNIPVLGRYINSQDPANPNNGAFKDKDRKDVWLSQFGAKKIENNAPTQEFAGQRISNTTYVPGTIGDKEKRDGGQQNAEKQVVTVGTAYHDLFNIANLIFTNGKLKSPDPTKSTVSVPPMASTINNKIFNETDVIPAGQEPNAGGRSIQMNLDGSMEMSVGADTIDRKSMVVDTAGGVISHFGRDRNGRSHIHQTDGDIIIQVGGKGISTDSRFTSETDKEDRPGRIEIHLNRPGATPQKVIIDEEGITFDIKGNGVIATTGDLILSAGGKLLLNAELIQKYGSFDIDKRTVTGAEKLERRKGFAN